MALKHIKGKIRATDRTRKVTKAMEAVSAVKMRKSQERALAGRVYADAALRILSKLASTIKNAAHPLTTERPVENLLIVLITSDKGLAGNLNNAVLKEAHRAIARIAPKQTSFICLGKRGYEHFVKRGYTVHSHYINVRDDVAVADLARISEEATELFVSGAVDAVEVVYQNFYSTFEQRPVMRRLLPIREAEIRRIVEGIPATRGKFARGMSDAPVPAYTIEPSEEAVYAELLPKLAGILVYHAMLEAKASEHSARMVAMKNASDKAKDVSRRFKLAYNKARQAAITREVSEITGGIEAMNTSS